MKLFLPSFPHLPLPLPGGRGQLGTVLLDDKFTTIKEREYFWKF